MKLKEGQKVIAENGDVYEIEDGDYVVVNNKIRQGPILNSELLRSIEDDDKLEEILSLIDIHGEHYIINQLMTGMNIELEHTDDIYVALNIAVDHVVEIYDYYTRLINMEANAKGTLTESAEKQLEVQLYKLGFNGKSISSIMNVLRSSNDFMEVEEKLYILMKKKLIQILDDDTLDLILSYSDRI